MKVALVSIPVQDPVAAHEVYTTKLGFVSKEFDADAQLAIVVSRDDPNGAAILLEPCTGTFAENYQQAAFKANLPIVSFEVDNIPAELERLSGAGVQLRPELDNPKWGIQGVFEDGCGNLLMLQESPKTPLK